MKLITKALILSICLHLLVFAFGEVFFLENRRKKPEKLYPIHLVELAELAPKPVVKNIEAAMPMSSPQPPPPPLSTPLKPKPEPEPNKPPPKKAPEKEPPEPKNGVPVIHEAKKEAPKKEQVDPEKIREESKQKQRKEESQKVSHAIDEIKQALASKGSEKAAEMPKGYLPSVGTHYKPGVVSNKAAGVPMGYVYRQIQIYAIMLDKRIKENWSIPKTFLTDMGQLEAVVVIRLKPDGDLADARIERRSGFHPFDESTIRAIKKAAPFDPPPADLKEEELEFEIRFHSDQAG